MPVQSWFLFLVFNGFLLSTGSFLLFLVLNSCIISARIKSGSCYLLAAYKYTDVLLDSLQGFVVAITFCYRNGEVSGVLDQRHLLFATIFENLPRRSQFLFMFDVLHPYRLLRC